MHETGRFAMKASRPFADFAPKQLRSELSSAKGVKPPEHIQVVHALPRDSAGKPRTEILQLVAMNQLDLIEPLMTNESGSGLPKGHSGEPQESAGPV
jgi:hypothetical protein